MRLNNTWRWILALTFLLVLPGVWLSTLTDWDAEIFGIYTYARVMFNLFVSVLVIAFAYLLTGRKPFRHKLFSVLTVLLTLGVGLLVFELPVLLAGFDYQKIFGTGHSKSALHLSESVNKPDPVLMHIHWPNSEFQGEVVGNLVQLGIPDPVRYKVDVQYDHNGFRNDRVYESADIAVIGDSFIEAAIIPLEKSLPKQLEQDLGVATVNLGQIAYGFRQELEVLKRYALPLSPKLVVWALFGGNDLRDVEWYETMRKHYGQAEEPDPVKQRLFTRNLLVAGSRALSAALRKQPGKMAINRSGLFTTRDGKKERVYFGQTNDPWTAHQWDVAVSTLSEASRLSREAGAEFVVVYIPRKYRIYRGHIETAPGTEIDSWEVAELPQALSTWSAQHGIAFIDTTPALEQAVSQGVHPYFIDDVHWNPLGHTIAAELIETYLAENRMYPFR